MNQVTTPAKPRAVALEIKYPNVGSLVQQRVDKFSSYHQTILLSTKKALLLRFLAGVELNRIKEELPRGEFVSFCKDYIIEPGLASHGCIHNYMNYAKGVVDKDPTIGSLVETHLLPETSGLTPEAETKLETAIHDLAEGKDITAFYRDLGVIREKKPNEHHPRKPVDVAATEEELDQVANEDWLAINGSILIHEKSLHRVNPENLDILHDTFIRISKQIADLQKANKKERKTKGKEDKARISAHGKAQLAAAKAKAALRKGAQAR